MLELKTEITTDASIKAVWAKLTDFEAYPHWNPFITRIEGNQAVGKTLVVDIVPPGGKKATFKPILTRFAENDEMRWVGTLGQKWLFQGEHYFKLLSIEGNKTQLIHGEIFTGLLVPLFSALAGKKTRAGFELMNQGIKNALQ